MFDNEMSTDDYNCLMKGKGRIIGHERDSYSPSNVKGGGLKAPPELVEWRVQCVAKGLSLWTPFKQIEMV